MHYEGDVEEEMEEEPTHLDTSEVIYFHYTDTMTPSSVSVEKL